MNRVVLQSWNRTNLSGDFWEWVIFANQRADGSWSVGGQAIYGPEAGSCRLKGVQRIKNAAKFKEAIEVLFSDDRVDDDVKPDWPTILQSLAKVDCDLSTELQQLVG